MVATGDAPQSILPSFALGLTWATTGHRPGKLGGYGDDVLERHVAKAESFLVQARPSKVVVGMALGWDIAMAIACARRGVPFVAAIPFEGQDSRWPDESRALYGTLLAAACEVHVVSANRSFETAFHDRNRWMVDRCDALAAMWNGSNGGTAHCVHYAMRVGRPWINLWPKQPRVLNKRTATAKEIANAVYIGRPSAWGNPFQIGSHGTRKDVVAKHRAWVCHQPDLVAAAKVELRGRDLLCFCAPEECHGDTWLEIANG